MEIITKIASLLGSNSETVIVIGIAVSCVLLFLIYIISAITGKILDINVGPVKLKTGSGKKECEHKEVCKQIKAFLDLYDVENKTKTLVELVVAETLKISTEKDRLFFKESVAHRMFKAEEYNIKIRSMFTEKYAELLKTKTPEDTKLHRDYKYYQVLITTILDELKRNTLKQSIENTNIGLLPEADFEIFRQQKSEMMFLIISEYLDVMYNFNSLITREEMSKINIDLKDKIHILYKDLYREIREIVIKDDSKINAFDKEIEENTNHIRITTLGDDPIVKIKKTLDENMAIKS